MNPPTVSVPVQENVNSDPKRRISTRLQGSWLVLFRLAWAVLGLIALFLFIVCLPVFFASKQKSYAFGYAVFLLVLGICVALVWFIIAMLIFWRKSNDWLALLISLMLVLQGANTTMHSLQIVPSAWQVPALALSLIAFDLLFLVFCLFPNGRFVPRWILWLGVLFLGWEALLIWNIFPQINTLLIVLVEYSFLGSFVVAQLYRYHSVSTRAERQQTKWIVFGVTMTYVIEFGYTLCSGLFPSFFSSGSLITVILSAIENVVPILIPLSFGVAILRYHLYDIDMLIHRTLVYSSLTAILAVVYFGSVIALQSLVSVFAGHLILEFQSPLMLIASTLGIAALFQPLRRRLQVIIDRRFYRSRYDAARILARFSLDLSNEVDLKQVSEQLMAVVQETMQPTHISLWLRKPEVSNERKTRLLTRIEEE